MRTEKILVTGADGFVGRTLCSVIESAGYCVRRAVRRKSCDYGNLGKEVIEVGNIGLKTDWSRALNDIRTVIHLAARVHVMKETEKSPLKEYHCVNVEGTRHLAHVAASMGVRRLIYLSSIGVNGKCTYDSPFREDDVPNPYDPYTASKLEAEGILKQVSAETGLEVVVIRAPLVYGPGVPGNFLRLLHWVNRGLPLPIGRIQNKRSFIYVENLSDMILLCVSYPKIAGETFLIADDEDLSTPELIHRIAKSLGKNARLLNMPMNLVSMAAGIMGKSDTLEKLCTSLQVDATKARSMLGWYPRISVDEGLLNTARWYLGVYH